MLHVIHCYLLHVTMLLPVTLYLKQGTAGAQLQIRRLNWPSLKKIKCIIFIPGGKAMSNYAFLDIFYFVIFLAGNQLYDPFGQWIG